MFWVIYFLGLKLYLKNPKRLWKLSNLIVFKGELQGWGGWAKDLLGNLRELLKKRCVKSENLCSRYVYGESFSNHFTFCILKPPPDNLTTHRMLLLIKAYPWISNSIEITFELIPSKTLLNKCTTA